MLFALISILLSIGSINALIPIMVIIILIVAAAGATRGFSIFNIFGVSSILGGGIGSGGGSTSTTARSGYPLRAYLDFRGTYPGTSPRGRGSIKRLGKKPNNILNSIFGDQRVMRLGNRSIGKLEFRPGTSQNRAGEIKSRMAQASYLYGMYKGEREPSTADKKKLVMTKGGWVKLATAPLLHNPFTTYMKGKYGDLQARLGKREAPSTRSNVQMLKEKEALENQLKKINDSIDLEPSKGAKADRATLAVLNESKRMLDNRSKEIDDALGTIKKATRLSYQQFQAQYLVQHNRLYGAPDRSIYNNLFNPLYGSTIPNIARRQKEAVGTAAGLIKTANIFQKGNRKALAGNVPTTWDYRDFQEGKTHQERVAEAKKNFRENVNKFIEGYAEKNAKKYGSYEKALQAAEGNWYILFRAHDKALKQNQLDAWKRKKAMVQGDIAELRKAADTEVGMEKERIHKKGAEARGRDIKEKKEDDKEKKDEDKEESKE